MTTKEKILRSLATLATTLIIFAFILSMGSIGFTPWGYKSVMIATGLSIFSTIFWWTCPANLFKD